MPMLRAMRSMISSSLSLGFVGRVVGNSVLMRV